jgi:hypothetical protein
MPSKTKLEQIEKRVDAFYAMCEKIMLRTILFGCFLAEVVRFVFWLFR